MLLVSLDVKQQILRQCPIVPDTEACSEQRGRNSQPLPPACHLADTNQEASEQIPEPVKEAGEHIGQTEVGGDIHTHDAVEHHQVKGAVNDEQVPANGIMSERPTSGVARLQRDKAVARREPIGLCSKMCHCHTLTSKAIATDLCCI